MRQLRADASNLRRDQLNPVVVKLRARVDVCQRAGIPRHHDYFAVVANRADRLVQSAITGRKLEHYVRPPVVRQRPHLHRNVPDLARVEDKVRAAHPFGNLQPLLDQVNRDHRRRARQLSPLHRQLPQHTLAKDHHTLSQMQVRVQDAVESRVQDRREHTCPWIDALRQLEHRTRWQHVRRLVRGKAEDNIALSKLLHTAPHLGDHAYARVTVAQREIPLGLFAFHKQPRAAVLFQPPHRRIAAIDIHLRPMTDARIERAYRHFSRARDRNLIFDQTYLSRPSDFCSLYLDHSYSVIVVD